MTILNADSKPASEALAAAGLQRLPAPEGSACGLESERPED